MSILEYQVPPLPGDIQLNPDRGLFSMVVPRAATNLLDNPSLASGGGGSASGYNATTATDTSIAFVGRNSIKVTPSGVNAYAYVSLITGGDLTTGATYVFSAWVKGTPGTAMRIGVGAGSPATLVAFSTFTATGFWQRVKIQFTGASSATVALGLVGLDGGSSGVFHIDALQLEADVLTTYVDGDQPGCYWRGTPHASQSVRPATCSYGGEVRNFADYGFILLGMMGIGAPEKNVIAESYSVIDGSKYQRTRITQRIVTLIGQFDGTSLQDVLQRRTALLDMLTSDQTARPGELILMYEPYAGTTQAGDALYMRVVYQDGLEANQTSIYGERVSVNLISFDPFWYRLPVQTASLTPYTEDATTAHTRLRRADGSWTPYTIPGTPTIVNDVYATREGYFRVGGYASGPKAYLLLPDDVSPAWSASSTLSGGSLGAIRFAQHPSGYTFVCGDFTSPSAAIAMTDDPISNVWASAGTTGFTVVYDILLSPSGVIYAIGMNGTTPRVAYWTYPSTWTALPAFGTSPGTIYCGAFDAAGNLYVGGTSNNAIYKYNGTSWSLVKSGITKSGAYAAYAMATGEDGNVYIGGTFTSAGGTSAANAARWNGSGWFPLSGGINAGPVRQVVIDKSRPGQILFAGSFNTAGTLTTPDGLARWTGYSYLPVDINVNGAADIRGLDIRPDGTLMIAHTAATAYYSAETEVDNDGQNMAYPVIQVVGPGTLRSIVNATTGEEIYFANYALQVGETITIDCRPEAKTVTSTYAGNVIRTVLPGSALATFGLIRGVNSIRTFVELDAANPLIPPQVYMYWQPRYWSLPL